MIRIAITLPEPAVGENRMIARMLDDGDFDIVHLRHPSLSWREMRDIIERIPQRLHSRLRLHGHFDLTNEFNLGGLHLNRRCPVAPVSYRGALSRSCHSVDEVIGSTDCDYVTLSPIFDSISKAGYRAAFSPEELHRLDCVAAPKIIALGGITPTTLHRLAAYNFAGYAMLGAAGWNNRTIIQT